MTLENEKMVNCTRELDAVIPYLQIIDIEQLPFELQVGLIKDMIFLRKSIEKLNADIKLAVVFDGIGKTSGGK